MARRLSLQTIASAWCVLMVAFLTALQFGTRAHPPTELYLLFSGVWLFGAIMLFVAPTFGAIGTAAYGVILGTQVLTMHGVTGTTIALALASFWGTGLALAFLRERRRKAAA